MKTYHKITGIVFSILLIGSILSCNDLKENVFSSVTEQSYNYSEQDFNSVIACVYPPMRNVFSHTGFWTAQEVSADAIVSPPTATGWYDGGQYMRFHYHNWNSEQSNVADIWNWMYRGALLANNAIEQIESGKIPTVSPEQKENGLMELRAVRAFYYWLICDNFGDAPLVTNISSELPEKSSRKEIYDFVVNELLEVTPKLSEEQGTDMYGRMTKWAAKALLANVYLNAEVYTGENRWKECITQCDDIINSGKCELSSNYKDSFKSSGVETSKEVIFAIPFDKTLAGGNDMHMRSWQSELKKKFDLEVTPWGSGTVMGVTQFIDTYDVDDSRIDDTWLRGQQYDIDGNMLYGVYDEPGKPFIIGKDIPDGSYVKEFEGYRMNKFEVAPKTPTSSDTDFPFFRYAQILLMKAECLLRTNQPGAGALVTQVRERAFKNTPSKAIVTDDQLRQNSVYKYGYVEKYIIVDPGNQDPIQFGRLYDELGWEFAWEAQRRRDMIRFGLFTKKSWLSHKPAGDYKTVFPIPETVLTSNLKLTQNPAYLQ
ncbi:RagB/SusD family nutrient uptake outer membrane protein [Parabacteroides timonensis]|uniref:RagB/SusD family nutrient uptake outer membrane protein n=1 Tax=Parabacteroides timonensis TaxID=1871013 RepID=UPI00094ECBB2|nr:RagB/SusD family nutrient uptake outer membrane protein [Parabacteroides timonensis]